jgi:hypothetical protein
MAKAAAKTAKPAPAKLPLKWRLKAWWEGYDPNDVARMLEKDAPKVEDKPAKTEPEAAAVASLGVPLPHEIQAPNSAVVAPGAIDDWSTARVDVAQLVWGPGFCGPGGPEQVVALSKLLTLSPEMSMLDLSAGLGGPARALAEHFGVWVTGYEQSQTLVDAGNELSTKAGMSRKAPLNLLDLNEEKPFGRRYDRAMGNSFLSQLADKAPVVAKVAEAIKSDGLLLLVDYTLADGVTVDDPAVRGWLAKEPKPLHLEPRQTMLALFDPAVWNIRVDDDLTDQYVGLVTEAWRGAEAIVAQIMATPDQAALAPIVLKEAELWVRRLEMFRSGKLQMRRILAAKRDAATSKGLSNW